jgi:elongation factor G
VAGYPVVDMRVTVYDGTYHEVDSNEYAFIEAARACFHKLFLDCRPELLEPVMSVEVVTPEDFMGPVSGSICQRRGRIDSMDEQGEYKVVRGFVPLSEMFGYANIVRTISQGRASFTMHFEHYETVPFNLVEEIVKKRREAKKVN